MFAFYFLRKYGNEANDTYLTRFKHAVEMLILVSGDHIFMSEHMLGKELASVNEQDIQVEKEYFKAVCFILRAKKIRHTYIFNELRSLADHGRYEYPTTLTVNMVYLSDNLMSSIIIKHRINLS